MITATLDWCKYSDVEYTWEKAATRSVFASAPHTDPAIGLNSATRVFAHFSLQL